MAQEFAFVSDSEDKLCLAQYRVRSDSDFR